MPGSPSAWTISARDMARISVLPANFLSKGSRDQVSEWGSAASRQASGVNADGGSASEPPVEKMRSTSGNAHKLQNHRAFDSSASPLGVLTSLQTAFSVSGDDWLTREAFSSCAHRPNGRSG